MHVLLVGPPPARDRQDVDTFTLVRENAEIINKVVPRAKFQMMKDEQAVVTISKMGNLPNFWRMVMNGAVEWQHEELVSFVALIEQTCDRIYERLFNKDE